MTTHAFIRQQMFRFFVPGVIFTCLGGGAIHFAFYHWPTPADNIAMFRWGAVLLTTQGIAFLVLPLMFRFMAKNAENLSTLLDITAIMFLCCGFAASVLMIIYYSWLSSAGKQFMAAQYALGVGIVALILNAPIVFIILFGVWQSMFG